MIHKGAEESRRRNAFHLNATKWFVQSSNVSLVVAASFSIHFISISCAYSIKESHTNLVNSNLNNSVKINSIHLKCVQTASKFQCRHCSVRFHAYLDKLNWRKQFGVGIWRRYSDDRLSTLTTGWKLFVSHQSKFVCVQFWFIIFRKFNSKIPFIFLNF